jgi:hypothetical protein
MYGPTIFDPFRPFLSGASAESWAQDGCRPKSHPRQRCIHDVAVDTYAESHRRQRYIRDVEVDTCAMKCLALWVMHRQRGEVKGKHVCIYGNLMRQEGSE